MIVMTSNDTIVWPQPGELRILLQQDKNDCDEDPSHNARWLVLSVNHIEHTMTGQWFIGPYSGISTVPLEPGMWETSPFSQSRWIVIES